MSVETETNRILNLPAELVGGITAFLSVRDAFRLSRTCKTIHEGFPISTLHPSTKLMRLTTWQGGLVEHHRRGPKIPVHTQTHTIVIPIQWRDQGWGNKKGTLFIVGHKKDDTNNMDDFSSGRLVEESPIAGHSESSLNFSFRPRDDEVYHLWYHVGGGGHHAIFITRDVIMHTVVYGSVEKKTAHQRLQERREDRTQRRQGRLNNAGSVPNPGSQRVGLLLRAIIQSLLAPTTNNREGRV